MIEFLAVRGLISVQDLGRYGWQSQGLAVGGAVDPLAGKVANALVGNPPDAAVLEILGGGFLALARTPLVMAFAGFPRPVRCNGRSLPFYTSHWIDAGSVVELADGPGQHVIWALSGGVYAPIRFSSRSECVNLAEIGWYQAKRAHTVVLTACPGERWRRLRLPHRYWPTYGPPWVLKVWPGPDLEQFPQARDLISHPLRVRAANRMGIRAEGPVIYPSPIRLASRGTVTGAIEVDAQGNHLLLGPERQTTGGYPVLWVVDRNEWGKMAELAPGMTFALEPLSAKWPTPEEDGILSRIVAADSR